MKTKKIKLHVRVSSDGSWICDGQFAMEDGDHGRHGIVNMVEKYTGLPFHLDSTVIIEAEIPIPEPSGAKTVQGTVAPGQKET